MSSVRIAVEHQVLRAALTLPEPVQRVLAGRPVEMDGRRLSTEIQLVLRLLRVEKDSCLGERRLDRARALAVAQGMTASGRPRIGAVHDLSVDGAEGQLAARLYVPTTRLGSRTIPTLLWFHGGGMALGDLESHDGGCRHLAEHSGVQVLSVAYRRPPEDPFPAAVHDCFSAYQWLVKHADAVDADAERLAVGGDSAGGNL